MGVLGRLCLVSLIGAATAASGGVVELTDKNFASATEGKNVFVMFQAPW
jgi:hypothetical protein